MNFFEHQDKARRQTRFLIVLFSLAVLAIIAVVNTMVLSVFAVPPSDQLPGVLGLLWANAGLVAGTTLVTGGIIGLASAFRSLQLRAGGGEVAKALGGTRVSANTAEPLRRRLYNVVEEMAIASGIPVPEVYVLEQEQGINAFAAGYSTADAAVAVTRGALEHLDRAELQGVIAHEFAHIFNGDMRLNIRLMGVLFGILIIAILGRRLLFSARYVRGARNGLPPILFFGLALLIIGYVGQFFGRWIKAAVSRQREFLADASAVQFTRFPDGISGALKKIGALRVSSFMVADSEEVGHMLFARGMGYQMFATHPPLEQRIKAIDPSFKESDLKALARDLERHRQARQAEQEEAEKARSAPADKPRGPGGLPLDPDRLADQIGQPGMNQIFLAAALASSIPSPLERSAHSDEWAQEVICALLLHQDSEIRESQLLMIAQTLGSESEAQVRVLRDAARELAPEQRLPLMEMAFPALRRRPQADLLQFMRLLDQLIEADGKVSVFEYALARLVSRHIEESISPSTVRDSGRKTLAQRTEPATLVLGLLAHHGHSDQPEEARSAFLVGVRELFGQGESPDLPDVAGWPKALDTALQQLDALTMSEKQRLVTAMARVVRFDQQIIASEMELMRVICGLLHVPLPLMDTTEGS